MNRIKDQVFRKYNDIGADTLEKYWGQIEYTAYWCIHLLLPNSNLQKVIPEGVEDVVLDRGTYYELHQVKCRDESQPPWKTADLLPILCNMYNKKSAFDKECEFHFSSDHMADSQTELKNGTYGSLQRLKHLLEILHQNNDFLPDESQELLNYEQNIVPRIAELLSEKSGRLVDFNEGVNLLHKTFIETNSQFVRTHFDFANLSLGFRTTCPDMQNADIPAMEKIYQRLLILIVDKTLHGDSFASRSIYKDDVINCRFEPVSVTGGLPDLDNLPGNSVIEKKALYGGFDKSESPLFTRLYINTIIKKRELALFGLDGIVENLSLALMSKQFSYRRLLSKDNEKNEIGPNIYEKVQLDIPSLLATYTQNYKQVDEVFCLGLLWEATDKCYLWWNCLDSGE